MQSSTHSKSFPKKLIVSPTINARMWRLERDYIYLTGSELGTKEIVVKKDFLTDFASIPAVFRSIFPKWGTYGPAAVIHDWLYYQGEADGGTKEYADAVFLDAMTACGVNRWVRTVLYKAVARFGSFAWISNQVKRQCGKDKMDHSNGEAFSYDYCPAWSRNRLEHLLDMWKFWSQGRKPNPNVVTRIHS